MDEFSEIAQMELEAIQLAKSKSTKASVEKAVIKMNIKCRQVMCKESRFMTGNAYKDSNYFIK